MLYNDAFAGKSGRAKNSLALHKTSFPSLIVTLTPMQWKGMGGGSKHLRRVHAN